MVHPIHQITPKQSSQEGHPLHISDRIHEIRLMKITWPPKVLQGWALVSKKSPSVVEDEES